MFTRLMLLSVVLAGSQVAALGQGIDPGPAAGDESSELRNSLERRVAAIEQEQQKLLRIANSQGRAIEQIAAQDESGAYYWRFDGNSQPAIKAFSRALDKTIPTTGEIVVYNYTNVDQWIMINRDRYRIEARRRRPIPFAPGLVITQYGSEPQINYYLGRENKYSQRIDIEERPVARYVYESPIRWVAAY